MTLIFARGRRFLPAIFLLILTLGIGFRAFAQGNEWRVLIMGGLGKEEAEVKVKAPEISGMGDVVVLPYQNNFGLFIGSFATSDEASKKLDELRGEGWLVQSVVQLGGGVAPAPTLEMATPAPAIPTAGSSAPANVGAPSPSGAVVYRLEAAVLPDLAAANKKRDELVNNSGVYPVDVLSDGAGFHVYVSYPATSRDEADREAANFRRDFPELAVKVVELAGAPSTDTAALTKIAGGATTEEINYLRDLQSKAEGGRTGRVGQDEARRAEEALKNLDARRQEILAEFTRQRERELDAMRRQTEIRRFAIDNNFQAADAALLQWRQADPSNAAIQFMQEWLDTRKNAAAVGAGAVPPELQTLIENAEKAQIAGKTQVALDLWQQVRRTAKDDATVRRAVDQIDILTGQLSRTVMVQKAHDDANGAGGSPMMMYLLIGVGVLVVVGIIIVLRMKKKSAPPPASASMRAAGMMTTPLPISGGGMMSAMHGVKQDSKTAPRFNSQSGVQRLPARDKPTNPRPSGEVSRPSAADLARHETKAPAAPVHEAAHPASTPPPAEEPILSSSVNLGNLVLQEEAHAAGESSGAAVSDKHVVPPAEPPIAPPAPAAASPADEDLNSAQTIRMPGVVPPAAPAAVAPGSAPLPPKRPPAPIHVGISAATPAPVPTAANTYYEQKFEDEEIGAMPRGWKGNYDYATLAVVEREGGGKCMKFEKGKGTGSAYFSCRFPDAAGRVVVEFNLRCDHKNKYLLGFYVEMDEDFRHSVHTVVHMDATKADKVSLRLQNETAPYKLGEWSRIRYLIDLPRNMVDGFVDDKPVAVGVRLPSRPRVVNTLSIRDNLATEGILMIDNIRIYKDRG